MGDLRSTAPSDVGWLGKDPKTRDRPKLQTRPIGEGGLSTALLSASKLGGAGVQEHSGTEELLLHKTAPRAEP